MRPRVRYLAVRFLVNVELVLEIYDKEFGQDDQGGKESQTWRNREIDWYNAERRFVFACPNKAEGTRWKTQINNKVVVRRNTVKKLKDFNQKFMRSPVVKSAKKMVSLDLYQDFGYSERSRQQASQRILRK